MNIIRFSVLMLALLLPINSLAAPRLISVTGQSETTVKAQKAVLDIRVRHVNKVVSVSHDRLVRTLEELTAALIKSGMKEEEVRRSLIEQGVNYRWVKNSQVKDGYFSTCDVSLYVNDINLMAGVYEALSEHRSVEITGTEFRRDDEDTLRNEEYRKAVLKARERAEIMAGALGARLSKVHTIAESGAASILGDISDGLIARENRFASKPSAQSAAGYGEITYEADVFVVFEIK